MRLLIITKVIYDWVPKQCGVLLNGRTKRDALCKYFDFYTHSIELHGIDVLSYHRLTSPRDRYWANKSGHRGTSGARMKSFIKGKIPETPWWRLWWVVCASTCMNVVISSLTELYSNVVFSKLLHSFYTVYSNYQKRVQSIFTLLS